MNSNSGLTLCMLGVPFDGAVTGRAGARYGPAFIRGGLNPSMLERLSVVDVGDINVINHDIQATMDNIYASVKDILHNGMTPVVLGGDHLITYAQLRAYTDMYGSISIAHFDAHSDTMPSRAALTHGTTFRRAVESGWLDTAHSVQVGMRGLSSKACFEFADEHGMLMITARQIHTMGIHAAAERIRAQLSDRPCMVTFDIDFLDPAAAPATGTPVPGGFDVCETLELLRLSLSGARVKGMDIVEVMIDNDPMSITVHSACAILTTLLSIIRVKPET